MIHKVASFRRELLHCTRQQFDLNSHYNVVTRAYHFYPGGFSVRASPISKQIKKLAARVSPTQTTIR